MVLWKVRNKFDVVLKDNKQRQKKEFKEQRDFDNQVLKRLKQETEDEEKMRESGIKGIIIKPFDRKTISKKIRTLLDQK